MSPFSVLSWEDFDHWQNRGCDGKPLASLHTKYPGKCLEECGWWSCDAIAVDIAANGYKCDFYRGCSMISKSNARLFVLQE